MDQYEDLFAELEQRRLAAPAEAGTGRPFPASLDQFQAFHAAIQAILLVFKHQQLNLWMGCPKLLGLVPLYGVS